MLETKGYYRISTSPLTDCQSRKHIKKASKKADAAAQKLDDRKAWNQTIITANQFKNVLILPF